MLVDETRGHEKDGQTVASLSYTWCRKNRAGDKEWVRDRKTTVMLADRQRFHCPTQEGIEMIRTRE